MLHFAACRILFEKQQNLLILMHILFKALSDGWQLYYYNALIHTRIQKKKKKGKQTRSKAKKVGKKQRFTMPFKTHNYVWCTKALRNEIN